MKTNYFLILLSLILFSAEISQAQTTNVIDSITVEPEDTIIIEKKKSSIKEYDEVILTDAITDEGLFAVHKVNSDYFFELPDSLLNKDMLLVTRLVKLPTSSIAFHAGRKTNEMVVRWERFEDKILVKVKSYENVADENTPISESVKNNFYEPTLYAFDIEAFGADSSMVINVTDFYSTDVKGLSAIHEWTKEEFKVSNLDKDRSFINTVKSFPTNIEVIQDFTYNAKEPPAFKELESLSVQVNQSMVLLPENKMQPRLHDPRVGWFTTSQIDYSSEALKADEKVYIERWRLIPKDKEAYARGELVEPVKPIVYYIDPATPEQFRKYFKEGIELWQPAFEAAGFKNAIIAKDPPSKEEDPDFSPEDVRYSVVRYVATTARNAMGPSVTDPRTGEIIESDILWYHNHLKSYRNRYLIETGAANPKARTLNTPEEEIGEMMKMVIAHEVGHTLGLPHNMAASYSYNVEDYRNGAFTQENGIATTIMDYARFNYIAQPGDENIRFIRQLGPYDKYAINWGYRYFEDRMTPESEVSLLDNLIEEKADNRWYKFGGRGSFTPDSQTEDIGNDAMQASTYGIKNLQIVAENLPAWTSDKTNNYDDLDELYGELWSAWRRYVGHVNRYVGSAFEDNSKPNQSQIVYRVLPKEKQKEAVQWLHNNVFTTPMWLLQESITNKIDDQGFVEQMMNQQSNQLASLLAERKTSRLLEQHIVNNANYSPIELFEDVRKGLFSELKEKQEVNSFRRALQKEYISILGNYIETSSSTDLVAIARGELNILKKDLKRADRRVKDQLTKFHYQALQAQVEELLSTER